jgi:hypothetical protein
MQGEAMKFVPISFNCSILIDIQNKREPIIMASFVLLNINLNYS